MRIIYTGPKDMKTVRFSSGDTQEYQFLGSEPLEVVNSEHLRFFLGFDKKGLFIIAKEETLEQKKASADEEEIKKVAALNKQSLIDYGTGRGIEVDDGMKKETIFKKVAAHIRNS